MTVDVVAVVGACAPEREWYARVLAATSGRQHVPASKLELAPDPVVEASALLEWSSEASVVEFPLRAATTEVIGALAGSEGRAVLTEIVCVVDAAHVLDDLARDDYVTRTLGVLGSDRTEHMARALLTVMQIEFASTIVIVGWEPVATGELAVVMALLSHLSPRARLRLHHGAIHVPRAQESAYPLGQDRPGWVRRLNGDFDPHMTDQRVTTRLYEQVRPWHPERLLTLLDERVEKGEFGRLVRSAGFCRFATRPSITAEWQHVGSMISFAPLASDDDVDEDRDLLAVGQEIAFTGLDVDFDALFAALDRAALSDSELADGPGGWAHFRDPLPAWQMDRHGRHGAA